MILVTPFVGVWIEIDTCPFLIHRANVTPFVGVWIEICKEQMEVNTMGSHSLRGSVD